MALPPSFAKTPATSSVAVNPGNTALTRTPNFASSSALQRVKELIAPLDAVVVRLAHPSALSHDRGDVDDDALALAHEVSHRGTGAVEGAAEVHSHDVEPVLLFHRVDEAVLGDPGVVVDEHVQATQLLDGPFDQRTGLFRLGDVTADGDGLATGLLFSIWATTSSAASSRER